MVKTPIWGIYSFCFGTPADVLEKQPFEDGKKNKSSWFSLGKPKKSQGELDMLICQDLAKIVAERNPWIYGSHSFTDGARTIKYSMVKTPIWGIYSFCFGTPADVLEKQPFEDGKKTTPK
jgi:hypothetical protein